jgi:hypothetical protein
MTTTQGRRFAFAAAAAAALLLVEWGITRTGMFARGGPVPIAVACDLLIGLPALYFFAVLRPARRSALEVTPALGLGLLAAGWLLSARPETTALRHAGAAVAELATIAAIAARLRRPRAATGRPGDARDGDLLLRIGAIEDPFLRAVGGELAVLYYAAVGPWVRRPRASGEYGYVEGSGLGGLLFAFGLGSSIEAVVAHLMVHPSRPGLAWALTAAHGYLLVWLVALHQGARLRPVVLEDERLLVRASLLWTVDVPRASIASAARIDEAPRGRGVLRAAIGAPASLLVVLSEPAVAHGPFGWKREVTRIALAVDEPENLLAALTRPA